MFPLKKTLAGALLFIIAIPLPSVQAYSVLEAVNSLQATDPSLPTGVTNPKGSIGYILSTIFGTGNGKIRAQYIDYAGISAWTQSGSDVFYDGTGSVGIGTDNPMYKLDINGNARFVNEIYAGGVWSTSFGPGSSGAPIQFKNWAGGELVRIDTTSGNVGIGTTPGASYKLDVNGITRVGRDLLVSGNTGGNYGNRLVVGATDTEYTLQDSNLRSVIQATGNYPVLSLNGYNTTNTNHGPTIQFTNNGVGNQFVIGTDGAGNQLDIGFSSSTDWNPHNGIAGYNGVTPIRVKSSGNVGIGGDWGVFGQGDPAYPLDVRGDMRVTGAIHGTVTNATNASQLNGLSSTQLFNNFGASHGAYYSFGALPDFGWGFVHQEGGNTDGPNISGQYYVESSGLGNEYGYGSYALQLAYPRTTNGFYPTARVKEGGVWQGWTKFSAGYADTAGSAATVSSIGANTTNFVPKWNGSALVSGQIYDDGTNVGIGTTTPGTNLDIRGNTSTPTLNVSRPFAGVGNSYAAYIGGSEVGFSDGGIYIMQKDNSSMASNGSFILNAQLNGSSKMVVTGAGNVGIGTTTPTGLLSVGPSNQWYISSTNTNTLNTAGSSNTVADGWINYRGYADGWTQARNFNIGNGQGSNIAWFDGVNNRVGINNGQLANYTLDVNGTTNATAFRGDGSQLTTLSPANISAGTAGINITGNATTAGMMTFTTTNNDWNQSFYDTPASQRSWREMSAGGPAGTWWFIENMRHSNGGGYWGKQIAHGWEDNANRMLMRNVTANSFSPWVEFITSQNIGSQTVGSATNADTVDGYHQDSFLRLAPDSNTPTNAYFAVGSSAGRNFIQSHIGQPLDLNPLGNVVTINGLTPITSGNIGSQSVNYATSAGSATTAGNSDTVDGYHMDQNVLTTSSPTFTNHLVTAGDGNGVCFWTDCVNYKISMGVGVLYQYGTVSDYSIKTQMDIGSPGRGFTWGRTGIAPVASLNATSGDMQIAGNMNVGGATTYGPNPTWGSSFRVGGDGRNGLMDTNTPSIASTNGNLHLDAGSGYDTFINWYDGGVVHFGRGNDTERAVLNSGGFTLNEGSFNGNGAGITAINPANISAGTAGINITGNAATATNAAQLGGIAATSYVTNGSSPTFGDVNFSGVGGDSGRPACSYCIQQESGGWGSPFPDLRIAYHTGIKIGAHFSYNGTRFYNNSDMATEIFSVGNGDNNVRVNYALYTPITYDSDNTGYYVDPASTSRMSTINYDAVTYAGTNYGLISTSSYLDTMNTAIAGDPLEINYIRAGDMRMYNGDITMQNGRYFYPGAMTGEDFQKNWYLASSSTWGLYTNTSLNAAGGLYDAGNRVCSASIGTCGVSITGNAATATNADTVDSLHASQFMRSDAGNTVYNTNYFYSNKGASSYVGSSDTYGIEAVSGDGGAAGMSFHRAGYYAVNMGLDPDNVLRIGGWSAAANRWQLDMSGNETLAGNITAGGLVRAGTNVYTDANYGYGLVGAYAADRYQGVYAMGDAYKLAADGTTPGSLYGIAWTHSNVGGQSISGLGHQMLVMENGVTQTAIGNGIWTRANITAVGTITATSHLFTSDRRLKENIETITGSLSKINKLNGVSFDWKESGEQDIGFIAQEVEKVEPKLVKTASDEQGLKSVKYANITALLVNAVKELSARVDELFHKYLDQQSELERQAKEIEALKKSMQSLQGSMYFMNALQTK